MASRTSPCASPGPRTIPVSVRRPSGTTTRRPGSARPSPAVIRYVNTPSAAGTFSATAYSSFRGVGLLIMGGAADALCFHHFESGGELACIPELDHPVGEPGEAGARRDLRARRLRGDPQRIGSFLGTGAAIGEERTGQLDHPQRRPRPFGGAGRIFRSGLHRDGEPALALQPALQGEAEQELSWTLRVAAHRQVAGERHLPGPAQRLCAL